jgi:hypothetical protein
MNQITHHITRRLPFCGLVSLITLLVLSLPVPARAQSGGPGTDHGTVTSIDDMLLDIRGGDGTGTRTYKQTDDTQWLDKSGQPIDPSDVVDKRVAVRFRFVTGGMEALSVQLTSGGGASRPARNEQASSSSTADEPIVGRWMFPMDQPYTFTGDGKFSGPNVGGTWRSLGMNDKTSAIQYELSFRGRNKEIVTLIRGDREGHEYETGHTLRLGKQMRIKKLPERAEDDFSGSSNSRSTTEARRSHDSSEVEYDGQIGGSPAVFRLTTENEKVTGTYSQGDKTYRLKGRYENERLLLDEYTGERLTAHIKLSPNGSGESWKGTMYNVSPNNNQYPVSFSKAR